jgi:hypothetical protein
MKLQKLSYLINKIIGFLKKIPIISQITIIYSVSTTIFLLTLTKIFCKNTLIVRIFIQIIFFLLFIYLGLAAIEDICQYHNIFLNEESQNIFLDETKKTLDEMYKPQLENKTLNKIRDEVLYFNYIENTQNYEEINPSKFYTYSNILLAFSTSLILIYFLK